MATEYYLIRHAKKAKGIGDVGIADDIGGITQAYASARYLGELPIHRIVSSPLKRAMQTARIVAEVTGLPVMEDRRARERANWGDLPGQSFEDFVAMWDRCTRDRTYTPPIGDSAKMAGERMDALLRELASMHPGERIAVVTRGGIMTDFLVHALDERELRMKHPDFIEEQSRLVAECSITHVSCIDDAYTLHDFAVIPGTETGAILRWAPR